VACNRELKSDLWYCLPHFADECRRRGGQRRIGSCSRRSLEFGLQRGVGRDDIAVEIGFLPQQSCFDVSQGREGGDVGGKKPVFRLKRRECTILISCLSSRIGVRPLRLTQSLNPVLLERLLRHRQGGLDPRKASFAEAAP
jgi:hypothetical protein